MIYIYTNLSEMDEYVKNFEQEQWRRPRPPTQKQLDNLRLNGAGIGKPDLVDWFRKLCDNDASINSDLRRLSRGCGLKVKSYDIYEVNGYRFRSEKYEKSRANSPVDVRALYECSCGRPHGKWAIFNGIVNDSEALAELKNSRTVSSLAAKRKRQEEEERARMEAHECRAAKEHAQVMLEWGRVMQGHNESMQRLLETIAAHVGMPSATIPPPPPTYGVSASPNPSHNNVATFGSTIGGESSEETLQRIAQGQFGGRLMELLVVEALTPLL